MAFTGKRYVLLVTGLVMGMLAVACGVAATPTFPALTPIPAATLDFGSTEPAATPVLATATPEATLAVGAFIWEIEDVDEGTKPALALTSEGVPQVAYMLEAMQGGFVKSAARNGPDWDVSTVAEGYFYGPLDLAIGPDDVAHIAYHDHQDPAQFKPEKGDAAYAVFREGKWVVSAAFHQGHDGWDNRLVVDSEGRPHMSAIDPMEFGGSGLEYYRLADDGSWVVEEVGTDPITYRWATSIALDPSGRPHITFYEQDNKDLALASRSDDGWSISVVDQTGDTGLFSALVIDDAGRFHVSYLQQTGPSSGVVKYATRGAGESEWQTSEIDQLSRLVFGFIGARNITSLALDSQGNPWIAYSDEKELSLAVWDGSAWRIEIVVAAGSKTLGQLVSMKLDGNDQPHIAYFEVTDQSPLQGVVKYATGTAR